MERIERKIPEELLKSRLEDVPFIVFDTETSLASFADKPAFYDMVEIGCITFRLENKEVQSFHSLVKPHYFFNRASCKAMHITESVLETSPQFPEIADTIANLFANRIIVGQNTQFDIRTIMHATHLYKDLGKISLELQSQLVSSIAMQYLDTMKIFSELFPDETQKSLDAIALKLGVNSERTKHSALEDAQLTVNVFRKLIEYSSSRKAITLQHLFDLQEGTLGKAKQIPLF